MVDYHASPLQRTLRVVIIFLFLVALAHAGCTCDCPVDNFSCPASCLCALQNVTPCKCWTSCGFFQKCSDNYTTLDNESNVDCWLGTHKVLCELPCYQHTHCTECKAGWYGTDCANACPGLPDYPACRLKGKCSEGLFGTGVCTCRPNYMGSECQHCAPSFFLYPLCWPSAQLKQALTTLLSWLGVCVLGLIVFSCCFMKPRRRPRVTPRMERRGERAPLRHGNSDSDHDYGSRPWEEEGESPRYEYESRPMSDRTKAESVIYH
eukprot:g28669.t1